MTGFEYGNTRIRAMRARLLGRDAYTQLAAQPGIDSFIAVLAGTVYGPAFDQALARRAGVAAVGEALRLDLMHNVNRRRRFFAGDAGRLANLALLPYDVFNLKTVLRGLQRQLAADTILEATMPLGELTAADLRLLANAPDVRSAIDLLATWQRAEAAPLLDLRAARPDASLLAQEAALDRWETGIRAAAGGGPIWDETVALEVDARNVMTALRLAGSGEPPVPLGDLYLPGGTIGEAAWRRAARSADVNAAIAALPDDTFDASATPPGRLNHLERALLRRRLAHAARLFVRDPLGIGVLLGYLQLKTAEIVNLRLIAQGIYLQVAPEEILAGLIRIEDVAKTGNAL